MSKDDALWYAGYCVCLKLGMGEKWRKWSCRFRWDSRTISMFSNILERSRLIENFSRKGGDTTYLVYWIMYFVSSVVWTVISSTLGTSSRGSSLANEGSPRGWCLSNFPQGQVKILILSDEEDLNMKNSIVRADSMNVFLVKKKHTHTCVCLPFICTHTKKKKKIHSYFFCQANISKRWFARKVCKDT